MTPRFRRLGLAVWAMLTMAWTMPTTSAAPYTWTTSGSGSVLTDGSGTWNTSALNWTTTGAGAAVAWPNLTTDVAVFGAGSGAAGTVTVAAVSTNGISFNQPGSGSYLLSGGTITLGGSSPTLTTNAGVSAQIAASLAGSAGLGTTGGGTLALSGSSAVSGTATIGSGEVILASGAALPSLTGLTVGTLASSATLRVQSGASLTVSISSGAGALIGNNTSRPSGTVIQEGGVVTLSGNAGSLVMSTNLSNTTYTGSASYVLQGGTLALNNTSAGFITIGRNATATFTQSGGAVTLARTNDALTIGDYATGSYTISGGSLTAANTAANALLGFRGGAGTLTVSGSGSMGLGGSIFLSVNAANNTTNKGSATINLQGGTLAINGMTLGRTTGSGTTGSNGPGTATFNFSGGTLRPYSLTTSIGSATAANNFTIDLSGTGATLSGIDLATSTSRTLTIFATLQGAGALTAAGGNVVFSGSNSYSGGTNITAGTLQFGNVSALGTGTATIGTATLQSAVTGTLTNAFVIGTGSTATFDTQSFHTTLSAGVSGSGSLTKLGTGTLTLSGSSMLSTGALTIRGGEAILASGATLSSLSIWTVGATGDTATLRVQSGVSVSSTASGVLIGTDSRTSGAVIQEGGVVSIGNSSLVLSTSGNAGTYSGSASYVLQGGTLALSSPSAGFISVGRNAPASFTQSGGVVTLARTDDAMTLGDFSTGSYTISGGSLTAASSSANALISNRGGAGTLTISGSASFGIGGSMFLAVNQADSASTKGSATINLQGGTLAVNGMSLGRTTGSGTTGSNGPGTATFNFSGGTLRPYSANMSIGSATAANNFAIDLSGTGATVSGIDLTGSTARRLDVYATLQGTGNITVAGGTVALQGANTFSGTTTIRQGTLALTSSGSFASSPRIVVGDAGSSSAVLDLTAKTSGFTFGSGQTVSGTGTIALPTTGPGVALAGFLAPGNSPGTLAFTGAGTLDLTQAIDTESGQLLFELDAIGASDLATVAFGTLAIGSGLLEFADFGFTPLAGFGQGTYTLFSAATITGSLGSGTTGSINGLSSSLQLTGNEIQLVVVPEPAAIALAGIGIGLAGWAAARRRRLAS